MAELLLALRLLLALLLYTFLGILLYVLWRDLRHEEKMEIPHPLPACLHWRGTDGTKHRMVVEPVTGIGRAEDNTLSLDDPFASAHHALLLWREGQWYLEDLESHNGTYLNGERLMTSRILASGDEIRIGETVLRFEITATSDKPALGRP